MDVNFDQIPENPAELDQYIAQRESQYTLKEGTEAKVIWDSDDKPQKTDYSIVYLHGFRASHPEGDPVHRRIAEKFGYNLYLSRLEEHGIESEYPLLNLTEEKLLQSAKFALEIGRRIGDKIILMGTSTGGSLSLFLASQPKYKKLISALILYSPLIQFYGIKEKMLRYPLARKSLRFALGKKHLIKTSPTTYAEDKIWNSSYALEGALALGSLVQNHMNNRLFSKVNCPVFTGYYYKSQREQDTVVSVSAIKKMLQNLGTRTKFVKSVNFPEAKNHVICSSLVSKSVEEVIGQTDNFLKSIGSHENREN